MKMFLACSQVEKFSPCILKIVDNVETSVFRVNFLFFSILYLFPLPFVFINTIDILNRTQKMIHFKRHFNIFLLWKQKKLNRPIE